MGKFGNIFLCLLTALVMCLMPSCSKVRDIKVTSVGLESISMKGPRSADVVLAVGIDNPAFAFMITQVKGVVKFNGEDFATYAADSLAVARKCSKVYDLPCSARLGDNVGLKQIMSFVRNGNLEGFTTDVEAHVTLKNGVGKTLRFKNLDLNKLSGE